MKLKLYRVKIELKSPIVTPLKGDTIWGHIAWGIANHSSDKFAKEVGGVEGFLDINKKCPSLVVSSAFPSGFLCKPHLPVKRTDLNIDPNRAKTLYANIKKEKKMKFEIANKYLNGKYNRNIDKKNEKKSLKDFFKNTTNMHNGINRYTNTVMDGNLFSVTEIWAKQKDFDIYVYSSYDKNTIKKLFEWAFEFGYGADVSTGKGYVVLNSSEPIEEVTTKISSSKTYMALAPFIIDKDDLKNNRLKSLRADLLLRKGKLGGGLAGHPNPYKKPVLMYDEGAVLEFDTELENLFIGKLLENMSSTIDKNICQAGFAPIIRISEGGENK